MQYRDYLKTNHWRDMRKRVFKAYGKRCDICGKSRNIEVHHKYYRDNLFECQLEDLMPICRTCHKALHKLAKKSNKSLAEKELRKKKLARKIDQFGCRINKNGIRLCVNKKMRIAHEMSLGEDVEDLKLYLTYLENGGKNKLSRVIRDIEKKIFDLVK